MTLDPSQAPQTLADQALDNLVHQFARPLDFLRELVQNSIDAGTRRIEVWLRFRPGDGDAPGVLEIHVDDWGEGMDEAIIDRQLTTMFSSNKENDLTKIGKFGIGFTSIFAIEPQAVLLQTGRHGESWELLFPPDRSFDKVRIEEPINGTRVTLYKGIAEPDVPPFIHECRWILSYWCEHSNTPVTFWDRTHEEVAEALPTADPFAAFAAPQESSSGPETVTRPLELEADLSVTLDEEGVQVIAGYCATPRYGFYNGGLTLLSTRNPDVLGAYAEELAPLSFKVKYDLLEHTLTRDNVLQDQHWLKAMGVLRQAAWKLREALVERLAQAVEGGEELTTWYSLLAQECERTDLAKAMKRFSERVLLRDRGGQPVTLREVEAQEYELDAVLLDPGPGTLRDALERMGMHLMPHNHALEAFLRASYRKPWFAIRARERQLCTADELFILPDRLESHELPAAEQLMLDAATNLLHEGIGGRIRLQVGEFGGEAAARELPLVLEALKREGVCRKTTRSWLRLPSGIRRRTLLFNRHHPTYRAQLAAAGDNLDLAAFGLVTAALSVEDEEGERCYRKLVALACDRLDNGPLEGNSGIDGWEW